MELKEKFPLSRVAIALLLVTQSAACWSMEAIEDSALRQMTGQDGIDVQLQSGNVTMDNLYWQDNAGSGDRRLQGTGVVIAPTATTLNTDIKINAGSFTDTSTGQVKPALDLQLNSNGSLTTVNSLKVCQTDGVTCGKTMGALGARNAGGLVLGLTTTNGIFSETGTAKLKLQIPDLQIFLQHNLNGTTPDKNQLAARLRLDLLADGRLWVDPNAGLRFNGKVSLTPLAGYLTDATQNGLSLGLFTRNKAAIDIIGHQYTLDDSRGLLQLGLSGDLLNTDVYLRGTQDTSGYLGANVMGSSGLALRAKASFASSTDPNAVSAGSTTLDLSEGGSNATGVRFSNFQGFDLTANNGLGYIDTGNVYVNLITAKNLLLPVSQYTKAAPSVNTRYGALGDWTRTASAGGVNTYNYTEVSLDGTPVDANNNLTQALPAGSGDAVLASIRGLELQAVPTRAQFIGSGFTGTAPQQWSIAPLLYGVNANVALWGDEGVDAAGTRERIGFDIGLTTLGRSDDGKKTTSLLMLDTTGTNANYIGLRNIDALARLQGNLELRPNALRLNIPKFVIALSGDMAVGCLPGRPCGSGSRTETAYFDNPKDSLLGIRLKLQSKATGSSTNFIELVSADPTQNGGQSYIGLNADLTLDNSYLRIVEPTNGSQIGLDEISGRVTLTNGRIDAFKNTNASSPYNNMGQVGVQGLVTINPNCPVSGSLSGCGGTSGNVVSASNYAVAADQALKVGSINLYPAPTASMPNPAPQRLGEAVITGGKIFAQLTLTPRN